MSATSTIVNVPPLENGDRLTRYEFEYRYQAMTQLKKAELIEGVVYVASPVRATKHGRPHAAIIGWLTVYKAATPGVDVQDNATVRLDADNEPQPDALLRIEPEVGGNSRITEDDYIQGSPELVAEIAASSASYDLNDKLNAYRRNGVKEYIVWQMYENRLDWFILKEGRYISLEADKFGIIRSEVFPGLWLAVNALRESNLTEVLTVLQQGLQTDEHQKFVEKLQQN
ncbi:Uma2 family endonuclease [Plectonema cf. radiosum LEGE 06105]|uniref:Uma2 family endonuclease n=1 Tax=Plectonema cf. radiosum LEGE 06105 TaxID=945769 RepID=A0A8J7F346_9CYAN|nr:Uma2 family endonuclease [Plectonema radiosum]MBE9215346.1 Uma2 family endonuclease [Plectonema cf. radiosum LEGE 06105]